jgi:hypothetical protein
LVDMVFMVAIARCFGVASRAQPTENKGDSRTKVLILHSVFERIGTDAKFARPAQSAPPESPSTMNQYLES